jgi:hypothetical protein
MDTKYFHHIHLHSPFPCAHLPLMVPTPAKDLFYSTALHFFKCLLIVQGGFAFVLQACTYCALIKLTLPITFSLPSTMLP